MARGTIIFLLFLGLNVLGQDSSPLAQERKEPVYEIKKSVDIPLVLVTGGWSGYAFTKIYNKDTSTNAQILNLSKDDINGFDRWAAYKYSTKAKKTSDYFFYGSMPLPLFLLLDKEIGKDAVKVLFLYLEAMSITGILYTGTVYLFDRYRPYAYNPAVPFAERKRGGAKNSFIAGHVALVGTATFFTAKVYSDYHPESKFKYLLYGAAIVSTGATAYLRHRSGHHFPSDILVGLAVGTLSGIMVPHVHKNKAYKNSNVSFTPFTSSGPGFGLVYTFK